MENQKISTALELVSISRKRNKLKREQNDLACKIRDNQKRVDLLSNLTDYLQDGMSVVEIKTIVSQMKTDYEDRIDEYTISNAEISKERRTLARQIEDLSNK